MKEEQNTEAAILKAAEEEFLDKGFALSKTTEIARAAGVTHAMLHYYFRTKENLFSKVFQEKSRLIASSFAMNLDESMPFLDKIARTVELHFEFLEKNPKLAPFVVNEIIANEERRETCRQIFLPVIRNVSTLLEHEIRKEVAAGTIKPIKALDLMFLIISLNVFVFIGRPIIDMITNGDEEASKAFIAHRKQENVEIILSRLKKP